MELLTVLAIVAVLVALVLPALAHARRCAQRSVCAGALHQVGLALASFIVSNRDRLPYVESPLWRSNGALDWTADATDRAAHPRALPAVLRDHLGDDRVLRCPGAVAGYPQGRWSVTYRDAAANNADGRVYYAGDAAGPSFEDAYATPATRYLSNLKSLDGRRNDRGHYDILTQSFVARPGPYYLLRDLNQRDASGHIHPPHPSGANQLRQDLHVILTRDPSFGLTYP